MKRNRIRNREMSANILKEENSNSNEQVLEEVESDFNLCFFLSLVSSSVKRCKNSKLCSRRCAMVYRMTKTNELLELLSGSGNFAIINCTLMNEAWYLTAH